MKLKIIKIGEPQPSKCPKCMEKMGYCCSDYLKIHYTSRYNPDGSLEGGSYSDFMKVINYGVSAYCNNCNTKLPFKINRNS